MKARYLSVAMFAVTAISISAMACPPQLKGLRSQYLPENNGDLCAFADSYQKSADAVARTGKDPVRIQEIRGPRLINITDWQSPPRGKKKYDAENIYEKAPQTWQGWDRAAIDIENLATQNAKVFGPGRTPQITSQTLVDWHSTALAASEPQISRDFRLGAVLGLTYGRSGGQTLKEIEAVENSGYPTMELPWSMLKPQRPTLVTWTTTKCIEDVQADPATKAKGDEFMKKVAENRRYYDYAVFPAITDKNEVARLAAKEGKLCGRFEYAEQMQIRDQIDTLAAEVNKQLELIARKDPSAIDPILLLSRAQRWFVSIHPFNGGNGRTSRYLMDYIALSLGLPASTLTIDMNKDIVTTEEEWAVEIAKGMIHVRDTLSECASSGSSAKCAEIPRPPAL